MSGPIVVGYMTVDTSKCGHTTDTPHFCVHDWRANPAAPGGVDGWGNVERTES